MSKNTTGDTTHTNMAKLIALKDEDITVDDDNPMTTAADWEGAAMKINGHVIGVTRRRGKQKAPTKFITTLRLSPEVMDYFKAQGDGWQTRIDDILREYVSTH